MGFIGLVRPGHLRRFLQPSRLPLTTADAFAVFFVIKTIQLVVFDDLNQLVGIRSVGGIA